MVNRDVRIYSVRIIKKMLKYFGLLFFLFIVFSGLLILKQTSDVKEACVLYKTGFEMPNLEELKEKHSSLGIAGPFEPDGKPGTKVVIMCAGATLCETSCEINYSESKVIESRYRTD